MYWHTLSALYCHFITTNHTVQCIDTRYLHYIVTLLLQTTLYNVLTHVICTILSLYYYKPHCTMYWHTLSALYCHFITTNHTVQCIDTRYLHYIVTLLLQTTLYNVLTHVICTILSFYYYKSHCTVYWYTLSALYCHFITTNHTVQCIGTRYLHYIVGY